MGQVAQSFANIITKKFFGQDSGPSTYTAGAPDSYEVALINGSSELSGNGYSRKTVSNNGTNFVVNGDTIENGATIGPWVFDSAMTYDRVALLHEVNPGIYQIAAYGDSFTARTADEVRIDPGQLTVTVTGGTPPFSIS